MSDNPYDIPYGSHDAPASDGFAVTPHDSTNFTNNARALFVGVGGDVVVVTPAGTALTFKNVPDGTILPVAAKRVNSTSTTATDIIGLR